MSLLTVTSRQSLMVEADIDCPVDPPIETPDSFGGVSPAHYVQTDRKTFLSESKAFC